MIHVMPPLELGRGFAKGEGVAIDVVITGYYVVVGNEPIST